jgi:hypothetical protein
MGHSGLDLLTLSFSHFDPERTFAHPLTGLCLRTVGRQHASETRPPQANLICFASLAVPSDLASSHRTEGVFMACRTRTKAESQG